jgi:oligosaccharyltransferase complex subunit epsilon
LFEGLVPERAFGEYVFASLLMHFVLIHFIN